jgi:TetR/AcrR family transcriptional repressor of nem operon
VRCTAALGIRRFLHIMAPHVEPDNRPSMFLLLTLFVSCLLKSLVQQGRIGTVMRDTGPTHGGFYKHFGSKDELLIESLKEGFRETIDTLVRAAEQSSSGEEWKAIVKTYLRSEMCEHPEHGCPLATLGPELARVDKRMKPQIVAELVNYKNRMLPFMPGRRMLDKERAFFAIFSTMTGAVEIARMLPDPVREKVLDSARDFLLRSF